MASYTYTPTTWTNGVTAAAQTPLTNLENGVANAATFKVDKDGTTAITGPQDFNQTLAGADKTYFTITASDGKQYAVQQANSTKGLLIKNITDGVIVLELGPAAATAKVGGKQVVTIGTGASWATGFQIAMGPLSTRPSAASVPKGFMFVEVPSGFGV